MAGEVITAADASYDAARRVHNGLIDRRPVVIARCRGTADVQAAVRAAREHGLEIAVRGGGHNVAGNAVCDGGLVIDLSMMRGVHVDPRARRARAQGGVTWGDYNRETQLHGLASTGGVVSTHWHCRADSRRRTRMAVGQARVGGGQLVCRGAGQRPRARWCTPAPRRIPICSGPCAAAAVTLASPRGSSTTVHPIGPVVTAGLVAHPFAAARDVLRFYRDFTQSLPDELVAFGGLLHAPTVRARSWRRSSCVTSVHPRRRTERWIRSNALDRR